MGRYLFRLPDVGEGVAEAEIVQWYVKPGDVVDEDGNLVDVMTDKATVEMTSVHSGTVLAIHGEPGDRVPVGSVLVEIEVGGLDAKDQDAPNIADPSIETRNDGRASEPDPVPAEPSLQPTALRQNPMPKPTAISASPSGLRQQAPLAAPATRRRAYEFGIPLQFVPGTGPGGRITPDDLDAYVASGGSGCSSQTAGSPRTGHTETKIIGLRRKIAERMQDAKSRIPHIAYVEEADVTELEALRSELNADRQPDDPKLTLLPFLMRALARLQSKFPHIFSHFDDQANVLKSYEGVHVGIATQTDAGLMVPVVRHVEALDIWQCAAALRELTATARQGITRREDLTGSTITITSLGTLGGIASTPVINAPEVAIIGPNRIVERPIVLDGKIVVRKMMNISSSFDHRIVDGYDAALFIQKLKRLIEHPALLFVERP